jgi:hypothetical protein
MNGTVGSYNPRVLIADIPQAHARVVRALARFEVDVVTNLTSTVGALREGGFDFAPVALPFRIEAITAGRRIRPWGNR